MHIIPPKHHMLSTSFLIPWLTLICPPHRPEAKKNHLRSKWIFLASGQGGGHLIFDVSFDFPLCYPKGAHSWHHRLGQLLTSGAKFNFPLCYPKGAHSWHHRLGQLLTSGAKFNFPLCYPKGANSWHHRLGQLLTSGAKFNFPLSFNHGSAKRLNEMLVQKFQKTDFHPWLGQRPCKWN